MKVSFQKLNENAVLPSYSTEGAAGLDMTATSKTYDEHGNIVYGTGLAGKIPDGYVGLLFPRSSNAKKDLVLSNSVGMWDSDYTGEIFFKFKPSGQIWETTDYSENDEPYPTRWFPNEEAVIYNIGDRIGQLIIIPYPQIEPEWVFELPKTTRRDKGWGSTGS